MIPVGTILPFYGGDNDKPSDYLFCNGDNINRANFPKLYDLLTTVNPSLKLDDDVCRLPDLRGMFLRGWDNGGNIDPDRKLGSEQEDALEEHEHAYSRLTQFKTSNFSNSADRGRQDMPKEGSGTRECGEGGDGANQYALELTNGLDKTEPGDRPSETRPKNVAVNYIIKS
ncbi:phage tail protein [Cognatiyoonia sp. IB215182]|uniref:phage tail protein n=1 Tax=Cognatiyoonia sp. IB215182 TaxID=3097353 RepID=UPI002A13C3EC|nr:phage tail protein [Cognatiyoonia sp. IB215182]MDX8355804.1 phage tail protein [Cognatiyoonia sp. IB215182]